MDACASFDRRAGWRIALTDQVAGMTSGRAAHTHHPIPCAQVQQGSGAAKVAAVAATADQGAVDAANACRTSYEQRPRPPGEEALYKYPTRRVGYHPACGLWWCGNPHNQGTRSARTRCPLSRSPASLSLALHTRTCTCDLATSAAASSFLPMPHGRRTTLTEPLGRFGARAAAGRRPPWRADGARASCACCCAQATPLYTKVGHFAFDP